MDSSGRKLLPTKILDQHLAVLGKTGSGKSSVLRLLVEGLLDNALPVCIIDPKGDWWGLKSSASGKSAGYPVIIFGGEHADVPINPRTGAQVAELVATGNRPCIIDLGGWGVSERKRFFIDFASSLFRTSRGARYLVIDEVHNFAPQGKVMDVDAGEMLHWANRLASEGRGKGITILSASQRPQKVHKDFLTCAETLIAMRVIHVLDRNAIKDWIDGAGDPEKGREVLNSLAGMPRGEGWVWSPEIGFGPQRVKFPLFSTYDSFKAQGNAGEKLKGWAEVNLEEVKAKLEDVVKEAEANDPTKLKAQIVKLSARIRALESIETPEFDSADLKLEREAGYREAMDMVEPVVLTFREKVAGVLSNADVALQGITASIKQAMMDVDRFGTKGLPETARSSPKLPVSGPQRQPVATRPVPLHGAAPARSTGRSEPSGTRSGHEGHEAVRKDMSMPKVNRTFLTVLAQQGRPLTRNQVAIFAGYSAKSRHVDNTLANLRTAGHVTGGREAIEITPEGIAALGSYTPLPTGAELRQYWIGELDKAASTFLGIICSSYPGTLTREYIATAAGYSPTSRHVDNTLAVLRTRDLISGGRDAIMASPELF